MPPGGLPGGRRGLLPARGGAHDLRLIKEQGHERRDAWLAAAAGSGVPDLVTFADGLRRERAELLAALTLPWSTEPIRGASLA